MLGVRFVEQNDNDFNDELFKTNNVTHLGDHGFLIEAQRIDYSGYKRKIEGEEDVKALIKQISAEGEEDAKAKENAENPGKVADVAADDKAVDA